jgi:hypothetical protein
VSIFLLGVCEANSSLRYAQFDKQRRPCRLKQFAVKCSRLHAALKRGYGFSKMQPFLRLSTLRASAEIALRNNARYARRRSAVAFLPDYLL